MERKERSCGETCSVCGLLPIAPGLAGATHVVAASDGMQATLRRAARFANNDAPVALFGETGTGKDVIARILHANSPRAAKAFVAVNVAALPAELLESELFGHGKGAFTGAAAGRHGLFEAAHGGTLFLDEIGEMPLPLQAKLLRVLQDGEVRRVGENRSFSVDVRIVCATHRVLADSVREGLFREDLYYRLKVLTLSIPPLRERPDDILPLALHFLADEPGRPRRFSRRAADGLMAYDWPGNVRELRNVVTHGAALAIGPEIDLEDLPEEIASGPLLSRGMRTTKRRTVKSLADVEREHIVHALEVFGGSQTAAAQALGIARNTLWRKLQRFA